MELRPWLLNWWINDERIGDSRSDSFGLRTAGGLVIIDPVPLAKEALAGLKEVQSIILTTSYHQRSAWRYRRELGVPVYAPHGSEGMDEEPDSYYSSDGPLPDGFTALPVTGFPTGMSLIYRAQSEPVAFCADLIYDDPQSTYRFPREPGLFNRVKGRDDARALMDQNVDILCVGHGRTVFGGVNEILQIAINEEEV
jgi:glyoxylase-like metal-dependent hydrolase (beta-lactamase superfamily II)